MLIRLGGFGAVFFVAVSLLASVVPNNLVGQAAGTVVAGLLATLVVLRLDGGKRLAYIGLPLAGTGRGLVGGLLLGIAFVVPPLIVAMAAGGLRYGLDGGSWIEYSGTGLWTALVLLVASAGEEFLFRGYPLRVLAERWNRRWALVLTSAAFGLAHAWNPNVDGLALVNIGLAGLLLGIVCLNTGSLWWAIGVHAGWNFGTGYVADLPVSGMRLVDTPLIEVSGTGTSLISGGGFGLEGGLAATTGLVLAIWYAGRMGASRDSGSENQ